MNTPVSREGNLIRYSVYLAGYLIVIGINKLVRSNAKVRIWDVILFALMTAAVLLFYIYRYNSENRFFKKDTELSFLDNFGAVVAMTIVVAIGRIGVSYLQAYGKLPSYGFQSLYLKHESVNMFWFLVVANGVILPVMLEFLTSGFLFNYLFRGSNPMTGFVGMIASGLIFACLSFEFQIPLFIVNFIFGAFFAWSYLFTHSIWTPIYLAAVSGIMMIVMM